MSRAEKMAARWADPEFRNNAVARIRAHHADPAFRARAAERMKALHADPAFNPLAGLSPEQKKTYKKLRRVLGREAALAEARRPVQ